MLFVTKLECEKHACVIIPCLVFLLQQKRLNKRLAELVKCNCSMSGVSIATGEGEQMAGKT